MAVKSYANTFIYGKKDPNGYSVESELIEYIMKADRIDKHSEAFARIDNDVKVRQTTAVLYRILMMDEVVLCMNKKELPASFKVFEAKDIRSNSKMPKVFIDLTGIVKLENGYFTCKNIDILCAYLISAMIYLIYHKDISRITTNNNLVKSSAICFTKLFTSVLDNLRVTNYMENRMKISYITAVYYLYNIMGKDIATAQKTATTLFSLNGKETSAYDFYYEVDKDFLNIDTFITFLATMFKMKGLDTSVFLNRWFFMYGKGTLYGPELLPAFLSIITNAYSGSYINQQRTIENICGRELVTTTNEILRIGAGMFDDGFNYGSTENKMRYR